MGRLPNVASDAGRQCAFCAIIAGAEPAATVLETESVVAFLDRRPLFPGHVLVVPRTHYPTLGDLDAALVGPFFAAVQRLSVAVPDALRADGTFVAANNVVSQSVPHLHVHVVPRRRGDGLRGFFWPRHRYESDTERDRIAADIRTALDAA